MSALFKGKLLYALTSFEAMFEIGLQLEAKHKAEEIEDYMKQNAPWEDQTGDARDGLTAEVVHESFATYIVLYHTVDYGVWLEIRWDGRFAIIEPTIEKYGPETMGGLTFGRILGGH